MLRRDTPRDEGPVVHELEAEDADVASDAEVWAALTRTFESPAYKPPVLPLVATELMMMASRADVEIDALVKLLEKDPLLAARVLKLCNAPMYGASSPVRSLRSAVVRLGLSELRNIVMEASLNSRVFKTTGYSEAVDRVRVHSTATAYIARAVTRFTSFDAEYAFLCALLHDVGMSAALTALGDVPRGQPLRKVQELWPGLAALHEHVGGKIAAAWKLPAEVQMVIGAHHEMKIGGRVHPVAALLTVAESLAIEFGAGLSNASPLFGAQRVDQPTEQQLMMAKNAIGLDAEKMPLVRKAAKAAFDALK